MMNALRAKVKPIIAFWKDPEDMIAFYELMAAWEGKAQEVGLERFVNSEIGKKCIEEKRDLKAAIAKRQKPNSFGSYAKKWLKKRDIVLATIFESAEEVGAIEAQGAFIIRQIASHDLKHPLLGYDTTSLGELQLFISDYAQTRHRGYLIIAIIGGLKDRRTIPYTWRAYRRALKLKRFDLLDWEAMLGMTLEEARKHVGLEST